MPTVTIRLVSRAGSGGGGGPGQVSVAGVSFIYYPSDLSRMS